MWEDGQAERDAQLGHTAFYAYVLDTDYGHYVGHKASVRDRVGQHQRDEAPATADGGVISSRRKPSAMG